ncbi:hypothetical protein F7725_020607 [Dissostichus mawsoni]|uniref:DIX domain-containing protein n=1 Tax=Dissostichus mawsoni TaxID=36200 RepID=A0A7J5YFP4_DISMA|nr:hypothetical protein F7725_020607 [Dissostichus mawsoni]
MAKGLSSASPAHSPKEEYVITQCADTPKEEALHDQSEDQSEPWDDKSELTEKKYRMCRCADCVPPSGTMCRRKRNPGEQLDAHQEQLEKEMQEARRMVFRLQSLLLHGSLPEEDQDGSVSMGDSRASAEQQLVLIRSRLDQSVEEGLDLKDALQQRLAVQEDAVLQLKQELLRCNMAKDQLEGENQQLGRKDRVLQQQQQKLDDAQHKAHEVSHGRGEELQLVREALRSLRDGFSGHDPQHHTLDTLEQGVGSLMDRVHTLDSQRRQDRGEEFKSPGRRATSTERDSWPQSSKMAHSHSSPGLDTAISTKVLYFTDRSLTPFLINIPKRLGEVTLRDFKAAVDRQGSFRYHFKALDPEFGTVKEEVFQDGAVVPGWEGKIVAWVEEDHGEKR